MINLREFIFKFFNNKLDKDYKRLKNLNPKIKFNLKKSPIDNRDYKLKLISEIPSKASIKNYCTEITQQGSLGSCGAQAGVNAIELVRNRDLGEKADFSPLFLYYESRINKDSDTGTYLRDIMKTLKNVGCSLEQFWPYDISKFRNKPSWKAYFSAPIGKITAYYRCYNKDDVMLALSNNMPVIIGLKCNNEIFTTVGSQGRMWLNLPKVGDDAPWGHALCLSENTMIPLLDGREVSIKDLSKNSYYKDLYVYSLSDDKEIVAGKINACWKTGEKEIIEIVLDNDEIIECTSEHLIMCRDGSYKKAGELVIGESLMPLYRKNEILFDDRDYEQVYNPSSQKYNFTHRLICKEGKGIIHHKDFNRFNNSPNNLMRCDKREHYKLHSEYAKSDIGRENSRKIMEDNWKNPIWKERTIKQNRINGINSINKVREKYGGVGFQNMPKDKLIELGRKNGLKTHCKYMNTLESQKKRIETQRKRLIEDKEFFKSKQDIARKNILKAFQEGKFNVVSEKQKIARRNNALKLNYDRWIKDKGISFEEYINSKEQIAVMNHKIVNIRRVGRVVPVYDMEIDKYHNFALSSGVFVHNCAVGYNNDGLEVKNSWGFGWGDNGFGWVSWVDFDVNLIEAWALEKR